MNKTVTWNSKDHGYISVSTGHNDCWRKMEVHSFLLASKLHVPYALGSEKLAILWQSNWRLLLLANCTHEGWLGSDWDLGRDQRNNCQSWQGSKCWSLGDPILSLPVSLPEREAKPCSWKHWDKRVFSVSVSLSMTLLTCGQPCSNRIADLVTLYLDMAWLGWNLLL